ncbi:hypothetical protein HDU67_007529, partial [Dinochytrium kinnereticum]
MFSSPLLNLPSELWQAIGILLHPNDLLRLTLTGSSPALHRINATVTSQSFALQNLKAFTNGANVSLLRCIDWHGLHQNFWVALIILKGLDRATLQQLYEEASEAHDDGIWVDDDWSLDEIGLLMDWPGPRPFPNLGRIGDAACAALQSAHGKNVKVDAALAFELCAVTDHHGLMEEIMQRLSGKVDDLVMERAVRAFGSFGATRCLSLALNLSQQARLATSAVHGGYVITLAAEAGHSETVREILAWSIKERPSESITRPCSSGEGYRPEIYALRVACQLNHPEVVRALLDFMTAVPSDELERSFSLAALRGSEEAMSVLLHWNQAEVVSQYCGGSGKPSSCLRTKVDPAASDDYALRIACKKGHAGIVRMLLELDSVHPDARSNDAIKTASQLGYADIVRMLLATGRVDPNVHGGYPIRWASRTSHLDVLEILLRHGVDPAAHDFAAVRWAAMYGQAESLRILLEWNVSSDISLDHGVALQNAASNGHAECVRILLDAGVDPSTCEDFALQAAAANGHLGVVQLLLSDQRVRPNACDNYPLKWACANGHLGIVKRLLETGAVEWDSCEYYALRQAAENGHEGVVRLLLSSVGSFGLDPQMLGTLGRKAFENGFLAISRMLSEAVEDLARRIRREARE